MAARASAEIEIVTTPQNMGMGLAAGSPCATWIIAAASHERPFHDNESGALQMSHDSIGDYRCDVFIRALRLEAAVCASFKKEVEALLRPHAGAGTAPYSNHPRKL
jgi:hypothetical protein